MGRNDVSAACFAHVRDGAAVWTTNAVEATILHMNFAKPMPGMASKCTTGIASSICGQRLRIVGFEPVLFTYASAKPNMAPNLGAACLAQLRQHLLGPILRPSLSHLQIEA
jgi:hypothetical protein